MSPWRTHRLHAAALAWVAALALAVLPTLSRATQTLPPVAAWADLCRSDDGAGLHHALEACGHCSLAQQAAPPPAPAGEAAPPALAAIAPAAVLAGQPAGRIRAAAPARAPPALPPA